MENLGKRWRQYEREEIEVTPKKIKELKESTKEEDVLQIRDDESYPEYISRLDCLISAALEQKEQALNYWGTLVEWRNIDRAKINCPDPINSLEKKEVRDTIKNLSSKSINVTKPITAKTIPHVQNDTRIGDIFENFDIEDKKNLKYIDEELVVWDGPSHVPTQASATTIEYLD